MMLEGVYCKKCKKSGPMTEEEHNHVECCCNGQEVRNRGWRYCLPYPEERVYPANCQDEKGFLLCRWCGLPCILDQLVKCPECKKYFRGSRPRIPFDYECVDCE